MRWTTGTNRGRLRSSRLRLIPLLRKIPNAAPVLFTNILVNFEGRRRAIHPIIATLVPMISGTTIQEWQKREKEQIEKIEKEIKDTGQ